MRSFRRGVTALLFALPATVAADATLQADLQALLAQQRLAGAVFALVDGELATQGAIGHARVGQAAALPRDARVQVGSVAKTVLSLAVLRLVSSGRVALDAPLHTLLPGVPLHNPWQASHPVRLRHLLDHTAGLADVHLWHVFNRGHHGDMPLADGLAQHAGLLRVRTPPGAQMSYSNIGYLLAGMVLEALTGERYEVWARRELLLPLGMADSHFGYAAPHDDPRLAWGHDDGLRPLAPMATAVRPGAQFTTTAADMARLARFLLAEGRGQALIDPDLLRGMGRPAGTAAAQAGLGTGYALGLARRDRDGAVGLCHEGSVAGWRAMFCLYPREQRAFFVAFNSDREDADHGLFYSRLARQLGVVRPLPAAAAPTATPSTETPPVPGWSGRYVPAVPRLPQFGLLDHLFDSRRLVADGDRVHLLRGGRSVGLVPAGPRLLRRTDRHEPSLVLLPQADGGWLMSDGLGTWRQLTGWERVAWWAMVTSLSTGAVGALWGLLAPTWRRLRHGAPALERQPGWLALVALLVAALLAAATGWQALGELTPGSAALYAASATLPLLMGWQALRSARRRQTTDAVAAVAVLQAAALLAAWGLLPLALWR